MMALAITMGLCIWMAGFICGHYFYGWQDEQEKKKAQGRAVDLRPPIINPKTIPKKPLDEFLKNPVITIRHERVRDKAWHLARRDFPTPLSPEPGGGGGAGGTTPTGILHHPTPAGNC